MSGRHAERIRKAIEAYNAGEYEWFLESLAEDVEWKRVDGLPDEGGTIRGRDAVRELFRPEAWARQRFEPREIVEEGDTVLAHGRFHAQGAGSGIELDVETYVVYRFGDDGLAYRIENWRRREDAERSSGLTFSGA